MHAAEFEVLDRFSVDGYAVLRGSADIPGGSFTVGVSTFVVKGGNVGIGTIAPNTTLELGNGILTLKYLPTDSSGLKIWQDISDQSRIFNHFSGPLIFGTANAERVRIGASGSVGIGTTDPAAKLDVRGADTQAYNLAVGTSAAYSLVVSTNGKVGIGTTAPAADLHVRTSAAGRAMLNIEATFENSYLLLSRTGDASTIVNKNDGTLRINHSGSSGDAHLVISAAGSVGIGTAGPGASLDVLASTVTANGFSVRSGLAGDVYGLSVSTSGNVGIGTTNPAAKLHIAGTGAIIIPSGTTAERPVSAATGMMRLNTTTGKLEYYYSGWCGVGAVSAIGGTVTDISGFRIHVFTNTDTFTVINGGNVEVLVVAGGGGGGSSNGGGGGGGGLIYNSAYSVTNQAMTVTVGAGGTAGTFTVRGGNGGNSIFGTLTAAGGGGGASENGGGADGSSGGSGGGGNGYQSGGGAGGGASAGQGNAGGSGTRGSTYHAGGGGGAGTAGVSGNDAQVGNGGAGLTYSISGLSVDYAGGGGGGAVGAPFGSGGIGGGGAGGGHIAVSGTANTGGGGGGTVNDGTGVGGAGGSGIVIIRYPL